MLQIISALVPIFALLMIGFLARRHGFPGEGFWAPAERFTYYLLFPALLVNSLSQASLSGGESVRIVLAVLVLLAIVSGICVLLKKRLEVEFATYTSFYQGSMRFNTFVALATTSALLSSAGLVVAAIIAAVMIPVLNILCVLVFSSEKGIGSNLLPTLKALVTNPLILACFAGVLVNQLGGLPSTISATLGLLGQMALPLGLLSVGAALNLNALRSSGRVLYVSSAIKLLLFPVIAWGVAYGFQLSELASQVLIIFAAMPTATSAYILARQLGGDAPLMAAIITAQTLFAMVTLPLVLSFVG
ncbi:AEC family transporter [Nitrincola nitratireducens]|uniref:Auxin efflux carrier n=1 Tax=Nitrincola nitratireducens TaxID=1229521 RepID=W9UTW4_9GAMM|nr:AEC family transporter [Nitrincola nitratireducens]EXJ10534.1 auxin efflux carrier [Nitrincola nitratireducens]